MAGTRYENQRRELDKSLKNKQENLMAKHRQGEQTIIRLNCTLLIQSTSHGCSIIIL